MTQRAALRDTAEATLVPMTERDLAMSAPASFAGTFIEHQGRYWRRARPGLYEPIRVLSRHHAREASRPVRACWGFHTTLADDALDLANATEPIHLLADLASFGPESMSSNRRYQLRRSRRSVEFVQVDDVAAIEQDGYAVLRSAKERTEDPHRGAETAEEFLAELRWFTDKPSAILIAGFVDGSLGGWIAGYAVGETAYIYIVDIATEALRSHISIGLHFEFLEACQRSELIREVVHSQHIPEDRPLTAFKASVGFPVVHVPSRFVMAPVAETIVRKRKPFYYYRLTGRATGPVPMAIAPAPRGPDQQTGSSRA